MVKEKLAMISTRGRYSIRILLDLAEHNTGAYIPIKDVAARQDISLKYIERIMPPLKAAGFIESSHGIGGGSGIRIGIPCGIYSEWRRGILLRWPAFRRGRLPAKWLRSARRCPYGRAITI